MGQVYTSIWASGKDKGKISRKVNWGFYEIRKKISFINLEIYLCSTRGIYYILADGFQIPLMKKNMNNKFCATYAIFIYEYRAENN